MDSGSELAAYAMVDDRRAEAERAAFASAGSCVARELRATRRLRRMQRRSDVARTRLASIDF